MTSRFDAMTDRRQTSCRKWDSLHETFGCDDVLPMWIADMDFSAPPAVVKAVTDRAVHGVYGYPTRAAGYYTAIINWVKRRQDWSIEKEWICHTPGVVPAISVAVQTFTQPGDGVIIQPPVYPPFFSCVRNNGRRVVENPLKLRDGKYIMDFDDLEKKITTDVTMLILCSPHNPVGRVWTQQELIRLADICVKNNIIVISDEIHGDLVFPGHVQTPLAKISPIMADRTVTCIAPSKTFNIAGLYTSSIIISNPELRRRYNAALNALDMNGGNVFGIAALEAAYQHGEAWLNELLPYIAANAEYLVKYIKGNIPGVDVVAPESTFLAWLDCRGLGMDGDQLRQFLIRQAKVGMNDGRTFGQQGYGFARLNFGCCRELLTEGLERLARAVKQRV